LAAMGFCKRAIQGRQRRRWLRVKRRSLELQEVSPSY
jgi:hypothetical protein